MFDQLVDRVSATLWNLSPSTAVALGKHQYDGIVPDVSDHEVDRQCDRLRALRRQLFALEGLTPDQQFDRLQLGTAIDGALFAEEVLRLRQRSPMQLVDHLDVDSYLLRSYAPMALRLESIADVLEGAPRLLEQARRVIRLPIPRVFADWGRRTAEGLADVLDGELPGRIAGSGDDRAESRVRDAAAEAARGLRSFSGWLEGADDVPFAVGAEGLEGMLSATELVELSLSDVLALGEADLRANLSAFRETAARLDPHLDPREVYERHVASAHGGPDTLIAGVREMLERIRGFVVDRDLVSMPGEIRVRVAETPRHLRWAFAMMDTPGPYEIEATEAYYHVTPVEPEWADVGAEAWLRGPNRFALEDISIHEVYPGHYVHHLHAVSAPTETARRTASYAFTEGWAHYVEQMMWEEGFSGGDPRFRLAQLSEALVRDARFVCAIRMHADGMTVDDATRFFVGHAFYGETPARTEAERGTFDPGYLSYTLGKLQILRLREDLRAIRGTAFDLKAFHDGLLSRGAPPVEVMRRVMLGGD